MHLLKNKVSLSVSFFKFCSSCASFTVKEILTKKPIRKLVAQGWVQAVRKHKNLYFVDLVDGTCFGRLQVVIGDTVKRIPEYGSSIKVEGSLVQSSHKGQDVELIADSWKTIGSCSDDYPFTYRQQFTSTYLRQFLHLRPRTRKIGSILRVRNFASVAIHKFFQDEGFCFVHTPVLTLNDCEGAGEVFTVDLKETSAEKSTKSEGLKISEKHKKENNASLEMEKGKTNGFFGSTTYLTVSGQLHLEAMACALSRVYSFGPAFRAESTQTKQHASEFQMIEAEIAFIDTLDSLLEMVDRCIKRITESILENCSEEVDFLCSKYTSNHRCYLRNMVGKPFVRMSYMEAIAILEANKVSIQVPIQFGEDLSAEHKRFLVQHSGLPTFVYSFPASLKPFYMKVDANDMAECFDLFAPFGGELCGGSLRENQEAKLKQPNLSWYVDLRKYGAVPHGGFGIGFDRLLQTILGVSNIRDIIPFPRRKHDCQC